MSELGDQYLELLRQAANLKERFKKNNQGDIQKSTSFLAEDWRLCIGKINLLSTELYKEHYARCKFEYIDCTPRLRRAHWKRNPSLRKREENAPT
jgi:hypothetical protein